MQSTNPMDDERRIQEAFDELLEGYLNSNHR